MNKLKKQSSLIAILFTTLIFSGCKGVPKSNAGDLSVSSSNDTTEAYVREPDFGVTVIKQQYEAIPRDGLSFKIDKFKNEFCLKNSALFEKDKEDKRLLNGVLSLFLVDANKDGYLDFIYTTDSGRSRKNLGYWIGVYDYHNDKELYRLDDPNQYDYFLTFDEHKIHVEQKLTDYYDSNNVLELDRVVGRGILDYSQSDIKTNWENFLRINSFNVNVTLADKSRTPITLKPSEEKDTYIIEHASVDKAYCITVEILRKHGDYGDLCTNLPVGYRLNDDYRLIQAIANNHEDHVIVTLNSDYLKRQDKKSTFIEACVSGFDFKLIFECDTINYDSNDKTLKEVLNWDINQEDLVEFSREYIPGSSFDPFKEEDYPFMYVAVANGEEATKTSYNILEGLVTEIDPALVNRLEDPSHYNFKTNNKVYSFNSHNPFVESDNAFYLMMYSKDYSYATGNSTGYVRFRDSHEEIRAEANIPGISVKTIKNANKILFKSSSIKKDEANKYQLSAEYTFNIAGNHFYVRDSKSMLLINNMCTEMYTVVSEYDFSSLFQ